VKTLWLYIAKVTTIATGFLFNLLLSRFAGIEYFGVFGLFLNLTFLFNVFNDWGFSVYGPLEVNKRDPQNKKHYLTRVLNFKIVIAIFSSVLYSAVVLFMYPDHAEYLLYGMLLTFLNLINFDWLLRSYQRFDIVSFRLVFHSLFNLFLLVILSAIDAEIKYIFIGYCLSTLISLVGGLIFLFRKKYLSLSLPIKATVLFRDTRYIVKETGNAFKSIMILNIIYSSNLLLLNLFGSTEAASFYNSYYILFSSSASLVIIAQDIFVPRYSAASESKFFRQYYQVAYPAAIIILLFLLAMPFYFNYFFPSEFKLDLSSVQLISCLGFVHAYRLMFLHRFLIKNQYKIFLNYNAAALLIFFMFSTGFILFEEYNEKAAILSLICAEVIVISVSVMHQRLLNIQFIFNTVLAALLISGIMYLDRLVFLCIIGCLMAFFSFLFLSRLIPIRMNFDELS